MVMDTPIPSATVLSAVVATDLGADRASPCCRTGLHLCTHPLTRLNLGARGDYPAYQSEIEGFELCYCHGGTHLVRDDVMLQDEDSYGLAVQPNCRACRE